MHFQDKKSTTTVCGAVKEGIRGMEHEIGFFAAGGKGKVSRKTPEEITRSGDCIRTSPEILVQASRLSAKVDSAAVQDGFQLYHHVFFYDRDGRWAVVQQGMNEQTRYARRYHWLGIGSVNFRDPARFSYAHGGKDGHPYPVDRDSYDGSIEFLRESINAGKIGIRKKAAFRRLAFFCEDAEKNEDAKMRSCEDRPTEPEGEKLRG
ncbi:MAG: DUF763 domain-containing protein [Syntrophales bacterium]|nr:DUF763 domain-containing protein [Syntrophales bacterium]MDD5234446.1 DUF763 domain-containing protein [Syntrophales bacterium]